MRCIQSFRAALILLLPFSLSAEWGLNSLSLQDAEQVALENNKQYLISKESTYQAASRKNQAISRFLPALGLKAEFREITPKEAFFNVFTGKFPFTHQGYSTIFQLDQPLFSTDLIFGFTSKKYEETAVRFNQANTQNELLKAVRDSYYAVVAAQISVAINRENVEYLSYALQKEKERLQAGGATPFEVNQSKTAVANAVSEYYTSLRVLKNARNNLILNLGVDPLLEPIMKLSQCNIPFLSIPELSLKMEEVQKNYGYRLDDFSTTYDFTHQIRAIDQAKELILFSPKEAEIYLNEAIQNRPDLASRKILVSAAEEHLKSKQGHYAPNMQGYVRYSYNDVTVGPDPFFSKPLHWSCGVVLSWNLFDSMLRENEIREARSQRASSRLMYDDQFQKVEVEIRNGLYQLEETIFSYLSANEAVLLAEQARFQAQEKLEYGRISPLEYRDSVNQLVLAKNLKNKASFELIAAYYELRYATGRDANLKNL